MITKKIAYLLVFCLILGVSGVAYGATDDTRYLVKSGSGFWKKSFGVRHQFDEGFTTDLTDWQLRVAKVFGVEIVPVKKLYVLPELTTTESVGNSDVSGNGPSGRKPTPEPSPSVRPTPSDQLPWGIEAVYGNDPLFSETSGGAGVNVAVLDTGVFKDHLDLKNRVAQCKDFSSFKKPIIDGSCDDKNGHGTHVAGTIAADGGDDGQGIYGIAPEANLYAYKVCGTNGSCWSDDIAVAIRTAADQGANVINMSLGSDSESSLIKDAINYAVGKNVLVVAAAGNDGPDFGSIDYPGANPNVVAVGAFDVALDIAEWSSRGINSTTASTSIEYGDMEFAAPGVIIESAWKDGGYVILSGTSMATPHVAGLAAKLWNSTAPDPDSAVRGLLHTFSQDLAPVGDDDASGFGFPHL
ncbi:MAG: S8 family peptidase [Candidatus Taylorbacteria bacterium]|nr:S8 family peptidase [Candidatus Taylorbacteria bacterium]